jgi:hypothetical protein
VSLPDPAVTEPGAGFVVTDLSAADALASLEPMTGLAKAGLLSAGGFTERGLSPDGLATVGFSGAAELDASDVDDMYGVPESPTGALVAGVVLDGEPDISREAGACPSAANPGGLETIGLSADILPSPGTLPDGPGIPIPAGDALGTGGLATE